MKRIDVILFLIVLSGCGLAISKFITYNFTRDGVMVSNVGAEMITINQAIKNDVYNVIKESFSTSLTYSGKENSVIKIYYREYSYEMARPSFTQELTYDLAADSTLSFKETKIKVVEATNNTIKFIVLECPIYQFQNGEKIGNDVKKVRKHF